MRPRGRRGAQATWSAARGETPVLSLRTENWVVATNEPDVTGDPSRAGGSGVKESHASFCAWSQLRVGSREPRDRMCACACRRTPVGVRGSPSPRCQPGTRRGGSCRPPRGGPALRRGRWMSDGPLQPALPPAPTPEGATRTRELWGWGARARGGFAQVSSGGHRERDLRPQGSEVCLSNLPSSLRPGDGQRATLGCLSSGPQGTEVGQAVSDRPVLCPLASVTWKVILRAPGREAGAVVERQVLGQTLAWLPRCAQGREGAEALPMPRSSPFWKFLGCRWSQ